MSLDVETIKGQLDNLEKQKNNFIANAQQCIGAISVLNEQLNLIKKKEEEAANDISKGDTDGEDVDQRSD